MKYNKLVGRPVFTYSLPGGVTLPSSPHQLRHCVCNIEKSYICMMCNCLSLQKISKNIFVPLQIPFPLPGGELLWANPPRQNLKPPKLK